MFPRPAIQARLQCFQNDPKHQEIIPSISPEPQLQPLKQPNIITSVQLQSLRQPNIIPPLQQPTLRQPNIILPVQQQTLRQPNIIIPPMQQPTLRQPNIIIPVQEQTLRQPNIILPLQQQQTLRQPNIRSPVQQKQALKQLNIISPEQQKQPLLMQPVHNKHVVIQQEQISLEVSPIPSQFQKKPVLVPKTLWQRLHPEDDELSLFVKSHYAVKQQRSVTKMKKLSVPRQLKQKTLQHSTDPLQEISILKEQAPPLVLKPQSLQQLTALTKEQTPNLSLKQQSPPQPIPTWRQEQIDLQQNHISECPQSSSGTIKTWQEQLNLLQETPIAKPRQQSGLLQYQRPIPKQRLQQTKQARQEPNDSLLQIFPQIHEGAKEDEDTQQKYIYKTRPSAKLKKVIPSYNVGGGVHKRRKNLAKMWRENQRLRSLVKPRNAYSVLCELIPVTQRRVSVLPSHTNKQFTAALSFRGKQYQGTGLTKKEAKSDAAEEVLRLLMNEQMLIKDVPDHNLEEDVILISDSEDDDDSPISMKQLTSLALYKLFEDWNKMKTKQSVKALSAPTRAHIDPLASLHPCDLLSRMRGNVPYSLILQENTPQGAVFFVSATVDGSSYVGKGTSKKDARSRAAKGACEAIFKVVYP